MVLAITGPRFVQIQKPTNRRVVLAAHKPQRSVGASRHGDTEEKSIGTRARELVAVPAAAAIAAALLSCAAVPEEALAARSGGRIGGSAFRSMPRAMPRGGRGPRVQNNYYGGGMMAPPLYGGGLGYGYGGFMPSLFFPIGFGGGGIIQLFITMFIVSSVLNAIRNVQDRNDRDDFDDFD